MDGNGEREYALIWVRKDNEHTDKEKWYELASQVAMGTCFRVQNPGIYNLIGHTSVIAI